MNCGGGCGDNATSMSGIDNNVVAHFMGTRPTRRANMGSMVAGIPQDLLARLPAPPPGSSDSSSSTAECSWLEKLIKQIIAILQGPADCDSIDMDFVGVEFYPEACAYGPICKPRVRPTGPIGPLPGLWDLTIPWDDDEENDNTENRFDVENDGDGDVGK